MLHGLSETSLGRLRSYAFQLVDEMASSLINACPAESRERLIQVRDEIFDSHPELDAQTCREVLTSCAGVVRETAHFAHV